MSMALWWLIVLIVLIVIALLIVFGYYNRFAVLQNRIENSLAQIDVQLKKRADLVPNLVETVKGYAKHEEKIMREVSEARKALVSAISSKDLIKEIKAGDALQGVLGRLFAIAENYPNLRANENFLQLQQELAAIEDKIAYARQFYNDSVLNYNNLCKTIPGAWFAALFGKKAGKYLEIPQAEREPVKVKF
ncbi:MAG: LemA family protein [Candidatus Pacearchaeota archaeon]|nr:LemA family protein [Candidatus Pacearchaeota archaeon]